MKKITIKNLVEFRRKTDRTRLTLMNKLRGQELRDLEESKGTGGDYWISCISALATIYKTNDKEFIREKVHYLQDKINAANNQVTKQRFQKNIDLLFCFEDFDFNAIRPAAELLFHKKSDEKSILSINGLPLFVDPNHVFSFSNTDSKEIGAVWFIAFKDGFEKGELGMYSNILYRYLIKNYSNDFKINPAYCVAVDVFKCQYVSYNQILNNDITDLLEDTVEAFKNFR
jgi:hypothetical protein